MDWIAIKSQVFYSVIYIITINMRIMAEIFLGKKAEICSN
jgi:hypothetical protein